MAHWIRFEKDGNTNIGTTQDGVITVYEGELFDNPQPTGDTVQLADVTVLTPCDPGKMICLWNNYHALATKMNSPVPQDPLFFLKASNSFLATDQVIRRPSSYDGKVVYEGELGIVIGRQCSEISEADAGDFIFGYTCINDVTAAEIISKDATFAQWTRAKSFDTFGVFGPAIVTDIDPMTLAIKTVLNGAERQNYPVNDMIFPPHQLISRLSYDMTLNPGDVIACGTSIGVGAMKEPSNTISITIEGIGTLNNTFVQ